MVKVVIASLFYLLHMYCRKVRKSYKLEKVAKGRKSYKLV